MADRLQKASRGGLMGRLRGNMNEQKQGQGGGFDQEKSQAMVNQAVKGGDAQRQPGGFPGREAGGQPAPGQRQPAQTAEAGGQPPAGRPAPSFDAQAFGRQMDTVGTAQGTREAQAAAPGQTGGGEAQAQQKRRLGLRGRLARR